MLGAGGLAFGFENFLTPGNMFLRLLEMFLERNLQLVTVRALRHFGKRFYELLFGTEQMFEFEQEQIVQPVEFHENA